MIIEKIFELFWSFITAVLNFINIPDISAADKQSLFDFVDTILTSANSLIDVFLPYTLSKVLLLIVIAIELAVDVYKIVMWVIRKIPVLGMS